MFNLIKTHDFELTHINRSTVSEAFIYRIAIVDIIAILIVEKEFKNNDIEIYLDVKSYDCDGSVGMSTTINVYENIIESEIFDIAWRELNNIILNYIVEKFKYIFVNTYDFLTNTSDELIPIRYYLSNNDNPDEYAFYSDVKLLDWHEDIDYVDSIIIKHKSKSSTFSVQITPHETSYVYNYSNMIVDSAYYNFIVEYTLPYVKYIPRLKEAIEKLKHNNFIEYTH